ncbi:hypothetical protein LTR66_016125, partial [Elasticomyces elasticus]
IGGVDGGALRYGGVSRGQVDCGMVRDADGGETSLVEWEDGAGGIRAGMTRPGGVRESLRDLLILGGFPGGIGHRHRAMVLRRNQVF